MAHNNQTHDNMYDLLVRVSGNYLRFNENVWQKLNSTKQENIPLVVLSVVGQPKSKNTSLINYILSLLRRGDNISTKHRFPFTSDDDVQGCNDLKFEEGILAYTPFQCKFGEMLFTCLLLDIWSESPRIETYNKLVDFCLNMSSAVIFSESSKEETSVSCKVAHFSS